MFTFFLVLHFIFAILMILAIVVQKKDSDGAIGFGGGSSGAFTPRGEANILTKGTYTLACLFFVNCLIIAKLVDHNVDKKGSLITEIQKNAYMGNDSDSKVAPATAPAPVPAQSTVPEPVKNTEPVTNQDTAK